MTMTPVPGVLDFLIVFLIGGAVLGLLAIFGAVPAKSEHRGKIVRTVLIVVGLVGLGLVAAVLFARFRAHTRGGAVPTVAVVPWMLVSLVVLGVIVLAALMRSGRAGRIIAGVLMLLGGLLAGFLVTHAPMPLEQTKPRPYITPSDTVVSGPETAVVSVSGGAEIPAIWHEGIELEMPAEVYPSLESAARALAVQAGPLVEKALGGNARPERTLIYQNQGDLGVAQTFRWALKKQLGLDAEIVQTGDSDARPAGGESDSQQYTLIFKLEVENEGFVDVAGDAQQRTGVLDLTVKGPVAVADVQAAYHEKPWLVDFAAFQSRHRDRVYVLARSASSAVSREQAADEALRQATRRVADLLQRTSMRTPDRLLGGVEIDPVDLQQYGLIMDRFDQRFYGTAGPIWRSAVLVDVSPDRLEPLIRARTATVRIERVTWARMLLRLLGLGVLITVVYVFLDTATRGYYTWSLRIAAVGLAIAGVVIVLLWA